MGVLENYSQEGAGPQPNQPAWGRGLALAFGRMDQLQPRKTLKAQRKHHLR